MTKGKTKISDNPSVQEFKGLLPLVRGLKTATGILKAVGLKGGKIESMYDAAADVLSQSDILDLPDQFNSAFAEKGWVVTNSMSVDVMRKAVDRHAEGDFEAAEEEILSWFSEDTINLFAINRSKSFNKANGRWVQLQEALALTMEERYVAAIPLILIASDGFASDVLGKSPFEKDADLTSFDSVVGHPNALPTLIRKLVKGVRKSSDEELSLPLRHGILHGRSLGYDNRLVCCKAWMLMIALVDWAIDKRDEEDRRDKQAERENFSWKELASKRRKLGADRKEMDAFQPIEWNAPFDNTLSSELPVIAFEEFLSAWKAKNYGAMAKRAVNTTQMKLGYLAGRIRGDAELIELTDYELRSVRQSTVIRAEARVFLRGKTFNRVVQGEFEILGFRYTSNGKIAMPTDEGYWSVQQGCVFDLMNERTIEAKELEQE